MASQRDALLLPRPPGKVAAPEEIIKAELCRFYGWGPEVVDSIGVDDLKKFHRCISIVRAREMLDWAQIHDAPHLKERARNETFEKLKERAYPSEKKVLTMDELAEQISGM